MDTKQHGLGAIRDLFDLRDYKANVKDGFKYCFADSFSLEMPAVKNQGPISSCVAHALATELEYFDKKETGHSHRFSTNYIYGNRRESSWKQEGMMMRDAIKTAKKYGDVLYTRMPGNTEVPEAISLFENLASEFYFEGGINRIGRYFRLKTEEAIKACLVDYGPVMISVDWYTGAHCEGEVLYLSGGKKNGAHCMLIYGWCQRGWLIQNSWGTKWGSGGRAILPYDTPFNEVWGIEDADNTVGDNWMDITSPFSTEFGKKLAKILNKILNTIFKR